MPVYSKDNGNDDFVVVIDPGHGGKDVGATDNGVMEKNINLKVAKQLESLIGKKMKNTKVVLTRDGDTYLTLQERADKANKAQGDIFISIHTNSVSKKNKNRKNLTGSSIYTLGLHKDESNLEVAMRENSVIELETDYEQKYSGFDPQRDESYIIFEMVQKKHLSQSISLADNIGKELESAGRENRGVHQAGFWVLWATSMPSVLVELDFICNPESAKYLSSDKGAKELAEALLKGIQKYELALHKSNNNGNSYIESNLAQTYIDESNAKDQDTIEVSTEEYTKAKRRDHKPTVIQTNNSTSRKRRSESAKQISMSNTYEKDNLEFPVSKNYGVPEKEKTPLLASETSKLPEKQKGKNKKTEKKPKESKPKKVKESKQRKDDAHNAKVSKLVTVYKIQILASSDLLNQNNSRFCGLSPISTYKENNLYKYYYGESTDKSELEAVLPAVRKKIPDAFIVSSTKSIR